MSAAQATTAPSPAAGTGTLLRIDNVSKHFGGFTALDSVNVEIVQGERFGLIGPNGSGKTTLINCITGALLNDSGPHPCFNLPRRKSAMISRAALWPGAPVTPPPGCVPEPHMYNPFSGPR